MPLKQSARQPVKLDTFRLTRQQSLRDQLYVLLRGLILTGEIKPGELIDEKAIAAQLNISRTPVREAVKQLSNEHLVSVIAQSATRAAQLDLDDIREAYVIRRALEMESAAQAASRMNQAHADKLSAIIAQQARSIEQRQFADAIEIDDSFHRYIAHMSKLDRLWQTIEVSKAQLDRCRHIMLPLVGEGEATIENHRKIVRALNTGDSIKSREAMQAHLDIAYNSAIVMLKNADLQFPDEPKPGGKIKRK